MKKFLSAFLVSCCTALSAVAQTAITLPIAANAVADLGNGPVKVRMIAGNASIFTSQSSGTGSTSGSSTALTLTATPATPPIVGALISGSGITSGTTIAAYSGTTGITLSAAMTVPGGTAVSWGAACPSSVGSAPVIQASAQAGYDIMYTQARVCAVSPGGPVNTLLIEPIFYDQTSPNGGAPANPTATAGPTAINGSASTYMRSDSAPAVQKGGNSQFGIIEGDGSTINCASGVCSTTPLATVKVQRVNNPSFETSVWSAYGPNNAVLCTTPAGTTTGCLHEASNAAFPYSLGNAAAGYDMEVLGGADPAPNGSKYSGAAVLIPMTAGWTLNPMQGGRVLAHGVTFPCTITIDSLEYSELDFEGSQVLPCGAGSAVYGLILNPTHPSPFDLVTGVGPGRIFFQSVLGFVHITGAMMQNEIFEISELNNGGVNTSGCVYQSDTATGGANTVSNHITIDFLHGFNTAGMTAMCIGTAFESGGNINGLNSYDVAMGPDTAGLAVNGIDTWGHDDKWRVRVSAMGSSNYIIKFESGSCRNVVDITIEGSSPTTPVVDSSGCTGVNANAITINGTFYVGAVVSATISGGAAASATLTLRSTSGTGTSDAIIFETGSQVVRGEINTSGQWQVGVFTSGAPYSGSIMEIRPGTNERFSIHGPLVQPTGVAFDSFNDAISTNEGLEFRSSVTAFDLGGVCITNQSTTGCNTGTNGTLYVGLYVTPSNGYTVSTLPASPPKGSIAYVTDAVTCTFLGALTGGGSTYCPVSYNGSAWTGG